MSIAITAVAEVSPAGAQRVKIQVAYTGTPTTVSLLRITASGVAPVRVGTGLTSSATGTVGLVTGALYGALPGGDTYDYEAPLDTAATYRALGGDGTTADASPVTLVSDGIPWLVHPSRPEWSRPLKVAVWPSWTRAARRAVLTVVGRKTPVVVGSSRSAREGSLGVYTEGESDRDYLNRLLDDGQVLLLKGTSTEGAGTLWVSVGDTLETPIDPDLRGFSVWDLPLLESSEPVSENIVAASYADATAEWASYAASTAGAATYAIRTSGTWLY